MPRPVTPVRRLFIASAAVCAVAGTIGLIAEQAGIAHGWAVFPGVTALFAWIAFERRTRR